MTGSLQVSGFQAKIRQTSGLPQYGHYASMSALA